MVGASGRRLRYLEPWEKDDFRRRPSLSHVGEKKLLNATATERRRAGKFYSMLVP